MVRISKILESLISQTAFDMERTGAKTLHKDYLMVAILRSEGSLAYKVVEQLLEDWQIYQITLRIEHQLRSYDYDDGINAFEFFKNYMERLTAQYSVDNSRVSTIDTLTDILYDSSTLSSEIFNRYGITPHTIEEQLDKLAG